MVLPMTVLGVITNIHLYPIRCRLPVKVSVNLIEFNKKESILKLLSMILLGQMMNNNNFFFRDSFQKRIISWNNC